MKCPYCNSEAKFVDSSRVYGKSYGMIYLCSRYPECDSYVGVHKGTKISLGNLANKELRTIRHSTHLIFDKLWKKKKMTRVRAYTILANKLGISPNNCHIGMFDLETCKKTIELLKENSKEDKNV